MFKSSKLKKISALLLSALILGTMLWSASAATPRRLTCGSNEWHAEFWNSLALKDKPALVRVDPHVDFNWGLGSPAKQIRNDAWSARWTSMPEMPAGLYKFTITSDDGAMLWVSERIVINSWFDHASKTFSGSYYHPGGMLLMRLEYYDKAGPALLKFDCQLIPTPEAHKPVATSKPWYPVATQRPWKASPTPKPWYPSATPRPWKTATPKPWTPRPRPTSRPSATPIPWTPQPWPTARPVATAIPWKPQPSRTPLPPAPTATTIPWTPLPPPPPAPTATQIPWTPLPPPPTSTPLPPPPTAVPPTAMPPRPTAVPIRPTTLPPTAVPIRPTALPPTAVPIRPTATFMPDAGVCLISGVYLLNVRSQARLDASLVAQVSLGEQTTRTGSRSGAWVQIRTKNNVTGWINEGYCGQGEAPPTATPVPATPAPSLPSVMVDVNALVVRAGASTACGQVDVVFMGEMVQLSGLKTADNLWVSIITPKGIRGWGYAPYLWLSTEWNLLSVGDGSCGLTTPAPSHGAGQATVSVAGLNVRSGPGLNYNVLAAYYSGNVLTLYGTRTADNLWVTVLLANGQVGWAYAPYLVLSVPISSLRIH